MFDHSVKLLNMVVPPYQLIQYPRFTAVQKQEK
jgi:hypothetical protein